MSERSRRYPYISRERGKSQKGSLRSSRSSRSPRSSRSSRSLRSNQTSQKISNKHLYLHIIAVQIHPSFVFFSTSFIFSVQAGRHPRVEVYTGHITSGRGSDTQ